jgi:predicted transcriptional regulator
MAMKEEGLSNKEIAQRFELSSSEVSGYLRTVRDSAPEKRSGDDESVSESGPTTGSEESALVSGESEQ